MNSHAKIYKIFIACLLGLACSEYLAYMHMFYFRARATMVLRQFILIRNSLDWGNCISRSIIQYCKIHYIDAFTLVLVQAAFIFTFLYSYGNWFHNSFTSDASFSCFFCSFIFYNGYWIYNQKRMEKPRQTNGSPCANVHPPYLNTYSTLLIYNNSYFPNLLPEARP